MCREEFKKYIEEIGFKNSTDWTNRGGNSKFESYEYKEFKIEMLDVIYDFHNGRIWMGYYYQDMTPFNKYFKKERRNIKLNKILNG